MRREIAARANGRLDVDGTKTHYGSQLTQLQGCTSRSTRALMLRRNRTLGETLIGCG